MPLRYHPGARLVFADGTPDILAYPRDRAAWGRLTRLLTVGNLRAEKGECILTLDDLIAHVFGLELNPAVIGPPPRMRARRAWQQTLRCKQRPRRVSARRLHALSRPRPRAARAHARTLAREAGVPLIAVNDVHYHHPDRRPLADVVTCIREKLTIDRAGRRLAANAERFLEAAARKWRGCSATRRRRSRKRCA